MASFYLNNSCRSLLKLNANHLPLFRFVFCENVGGPVCYRWLNLQKSSGEDVTEMHSGNFGFY
jgi:hypothetical protein